VSHCGRSGPAPALVAGRPARTRPLVLSLTLVLAVLLTGCLPSHPIGQDPSPGDSHTGGGSDSVGSGPGQPSSGPALDDPAGQNPSEGRELDPWGEWVTRFQDGQGFRYRVNLVDKGVASNGWFDLVFTDVGEGRIRVNYSGEMGAPFSGSFVSARSRVDWQTGMSDSPLACALLLGLTVTPVVALDVVGQSWNVGAFWILGQGPTAMSITVTGRRAYGGITGAVADWTTPEATSLFCVNPNVPLALYAKLVTDASNYIEYILTGCIGF
jgi:hypothetical protein